MTEWLTTQQVAEHIKMSSDYVARLCATGALKAKKLGTEWRISDTALEQFMSGGGAAPPTRVRLSARQMRRTG